MKKLLSLAILLGMSVYAAEVSFAAHKTILYHGIDCAEDPLLVREHGPDFYMSRVRRLAGWLKTARPQPLVCSLSTQSGEVFIPDNLQFAYVRATGPFETKLCFIQPYGGVHCGPTASTTSTLIQVHPPQEVPDYTVLAVLTVWFPNAGSAILYGYDVYWREPNPWWFASN